MPENEIPPAMRVDIYWYGYKDSNLSGFDRLFFTTASLKSLIMRQHSLVFCLALVKNRQFKTAKHLSRRKFCANLLDIDAAWRGAVVLSRKYGFYLLICLHTALKMLEIHAGISPLFALSANKLAKYKLLCTLAVLARCSLDFEKADWLSPINFEKSKMCFDNTARACLCDNTIALKEKSSKLAKNNKRETKRFESLYP